MNARVSFAVGLILAVAFQWAAADGHGHNPSYTERIAMLRELDQVFRWAGVRRLSELQQLECGEWKDYAQCKAKVALAVDGRRLPYNVEFAGKPRKVKFASFYPDEPTPDVKTSGFYTPDQNTITNPKVRAFAVAAVTKFNKHLHRHWFSGPSIHREGRNLLVTYHLFSDEESKRVAYLEPTLLTFYVSPHGTICGAVYSE
jgi:hypothetical protein